VAFQGGERDARGPSKRLIVSVEEISWLDVTLTSLARASTHNIWLTGSRPSMYTAVSN
jgi:hypothetical protein